jgi:hypothetical protein
MFIEILIPPRLPGSISGMVMWDLWWTKWHWGKVSLIISVSLANSHSLTKWNLHSVSVSLHPSSYANEKNYALI